MLERAWLQNTFILMMALIAAAKPVVPTASMLANEQRTVGGGGEPYSLVAILKRGV